MKLFHSLMAIEKPDNSVIDLPEVSADQNNFQTGLTIAFGVAAAIAVLTLVMAAFNFATADGDADKIARAKKAILLALIGLAIAVTAEAIVLTVLDKV